MSFTRGVNALDVMGEPVESLAGADDGWNDISTAKFEVVENPTTGRARANTVSYAHIARSRDLQKPTEIGPSCVAPVVSSDSSAGGSNESS